jgi:hypothetical protein
MHDNLSDVCCMKVLSEVELFIRLELLQAARISERSDF